MTIELTLLAAGHCTQSARLVLPGRETGKVLFPALFALLEHPRHGPILFDTGYAPRFLDATSAFPGSLYARLLPPTIPPEQTAREQLLRRGIPPEAVRWIVISHFHPDHIAGLRDFPRARFIFFGPAFDRVARRRGLAALRSGFFPALLPDDFYRRARPIDPGSYIHLSADYAPFPTAVDLLADGSLLAVHLPGHAPGQMGLFVDADDGRRYFLLADACWHSRACRERILPHPLAWLIFHHWPAYMTTFGRIARFAELHPQVELVPSHCAAVYDRFILPAAVP